MLQAEIIRNDQTRQVIWELSSANSVTEDWQSGQFKINPKAEGGDFQVETTEKRNVFRLLILHFPSIQTGRLESSL